MIEPAVWVQMQSADVGERVAAIRRAAERGDVSSVPHLVDRLEDEDVVVRFAAIMALEELTGDRLGYAYGAAAEKRATAVSRWRRFVARQVADRASTGASSTTSD